MPQQQRKRRIIWFFSIIFIAAVTLAIFGFDTFFSKVELDTSMLQPPQKIEATQGTLKGSVRIEWSEVEDATHYELYRKSSDEAEFLLRQKNLIQNRFTDADVEAGLEYTYKVVAFNAKTRSEDSQSVTGFASVSAPKVIASNGTQKEGIKIWWRGFKGAQKYALYRYDTQSKKWQKLSDALTGSSYVDREVRRGREYFYKIKAYQNGRWSRFSGSDKGYARLKAPQALVAGDGTSPYGIELQWQPSADAKAYDIYRARNSQGPYERVGKGVLGSRFTDTKAKRGWYYFYKVRAAGRYPSRMSQYDKGHVKVEAPKALRATDGSKKRIFITWEEGGSEAEYDLYRSTQKETGYTLIASSLRDDYYVDKGRDPAVTYYYRVKRRVREFVSPFSKSDSGYVGVDYPTALHATDGSSPYHIDLKWRSSPAQHYSIYRSTTPNGPFKVIDDNVTVMSYRDRAIDFCRNYYYRVQASKYGKKSRLSSWESGYGKCGAFVDTFSGTGDMGGRDDSKDDATFNRPTGIVYRFGKLYVADTFNHRIRMIEDGKAVTIAGDGSAGSKTGQALHASFYRPTGIVVNAEGTIYVAEVDNHLIRKITPDGMVSVLAGSGKAGDQEGQGRAAAFNKPYNLALDKEGNLYVTELGNHKIKKITSKGYVTTLAGNATPGARDGSLLYASFNRPAGIAIDGQGRIFVADSDNNMIRLITPDGKVRSFAGNTKSGYHDGKGVGASFNNPTGLAFDRAGNLYVADTGNHKIRMITPEGIVKSVAGSLQSGDKDGFEGDAAFFSPRGLAVDDLGSIYVTDFHAHKIRKITIRSK